MQPTTPAVQASSGGPGLQSVAVRYEHSQSLAALLERLELSVLLSTYQAGRVVSVGSHRGELRLGFSRFDQAMGLTRTASGIAVRTCVDDVARMAFC